MAAFHILILVVACLCARGMSQQPITAEDCPSFNETGTVTVDVFDGMCYHFHLAEKKTFQYATNLCQSQGGKLLQPKSIDASGYFWFLIKRVKESKEDVWIGALRDDSAKTSKYFWQSGEEVSPDTVQSLLTYGVAYTVPVREGIWRFDLASKDETHAFVCEFEPVVRQTTTTSEPTTTTAAITTTTMPTTTPVPTAPTLLDQLCPHLPNYQFYMKLFGQTCFYFRLNALKTYDQAKQDCKDLGGSLAIVNTELRDCFIQYHLKNSFRNQPTVWIGLHSKSGQASKFAWEDGSPVTYSNFNSAKASGEGVMLFEVDDKWHAEPKDETFQLNYVCQFDSKIQV